MSCCSGMSAAAPPRVTGGGPGQYPSPYGPYGAQPSGYGYGSAYGYGSGYGAGSPYGSPYRAASAATPAYAGYQQLQGLVGQLVQLTHALQQLVHVLSGAYGPQQYPSLPPQQFPPSAPSPQLPPSGQLPPSAPAPGPPLPPAGQAPVPGRPLDGITPDQFRDSDGLSQAEKSSACGPTAAVAFARYLGRPLTIADAARVGREGGWWSTNGMKGPDAQVAMLQRLGINVRKENHVDWERVKREVQAGRPVIIDTPGHYWVVEGFNPATGEFDFGNSGSVFRSANGDQWYRPEEMVPLSGAARSAIYLA